MNAMVVSTSDVDLSSWTRRQLATIEFMVCEEVFDLIPFDVIVLPCFTGCGTFIMYQEDIPEVIPKVCRTCSTWLISCHEA